MSNAYPNEKFMEQEVTYVAEVDGRLIVIERVPARVCLETGEKLYSPETVERIQAIAWGHAPPIRTITAPVYEFSDPRASPAISSGALTSRREALQTAGCALTTHRSVRCNLGRGASRRWHRCVVADSTHPTCLLVCPSGTSPRVSASSKFSIGALELAVDRGKQFLILDVPDRFSRRRHVRPRRGWRSSGRAANRGTPRSAR